jgi:peptide/nickel transport system ATP-binding protein
LLQRLVTRTPKRILKAVDDISFSIGSGETFALVGESGCGKSTVARLGVGLHRPTGGEVIFDGVRVEGGSRREKAERRRRVQMIFQDPYASLNSRWRVGDIVAEPIRLHNREMTKAETSDRVGELLSLVNLSPADARKYPHEFSGGQRQRISIARALSTNPDFLVCDEPTSALDVSVQAQVLNLMCDLQARFGLTYLFISHNLAVVSHMAARVGVMYLGRLVECGPSETVFETPLHPYTRMLIDAVPTAEGRARKVYSVPRGEAPNPMAAPSGCAFHPRCPFANDRCRNEKPSLSTPSTSPELVVACHAVEEGRIA